MGSLSARFAGLAIVLLMVFSGMMVLTAILVEEPDMEAEAAMSPKKDAFGYMWVDNNDPEPTVEYDWIDAKNNPRSVEMDEIEVSNPYNGQAYQYYDLPFDFPFYGEYYSRTAVCGAGYIDFAGFQYSYAPGYYYMYQIPYSSYENGFIAAWAGYVGDANGGSDFTVYALQGETYGEKWVCFEWWNAYCYFYYTDPGNELNFQIIIYESGLIKLQYKDTVTQYSSYSNGYYGFAGIENPTGTVGLEYSGRMDTNLKDGLAVMIGMNLAEVNSMAVETEEGGALYAMYQDYTITAEVKHPINNDMIRVVAITMGNNLADLVYFQSMDGSYYFSEVDSNNFVILNADTSMAEVSGEYLKLTFKFAPTFAYPVTAFQNLKIQVLGAGVMPGSTTMRDAYWVENRLEMVGSMVAVSDAVGVIENGGWIRGGETFHFQGIRSVYPGTTKSPMAGTYTYTISDEVGNEFVQNDVVDTSNVEVVSENDQVQKQYRLNITGVPAGTDVSDPVIFIMNVDPYRPTPPKEVLIHADSFEDRNTEFDDDNEVFVTWEPSEDFESGVSGYYVATFDPFLAGADLEEAIFVKNPDTSTKLVFEDMGTRKVYVWAMDRAGNPSIPTFSVTKIDATEVTFAEFSPGHQVWVNTRRPVCSVLIDDMGGSGVSAKNLEYSLSTTNTLEYGAWQSSSLGRDNEQVRLSVQGIFENGKSNYIKFRAKDVAGNGWTVSKDYNVWVDEERPSYTGFRPYETEYQNSRNVVVSVDITDIHALRAGSGIRLDTVEYRMSTQGKGQFGDWMAAPISSVDENGIVHVEMELDFEEGSDNYIQFRCFDQIGNFASSKEYNVKVNAAPLIDAFLADPKNGHTYTTSEKILFDASGTEDPDGDLLEFAWYSDINGFLSADDSFFRTLSPGVHIIRLVVNDPAHSIVEAWEVEVLEETQINPEDIDTDGDGIYDDWEIRYGLDPDRPDSFIDADNDKFTNLQEFQNGTDPTRSVSHPPYPTIEAESDSDDDTADQYRNITLALALVALLVVIILSLLAYTKHKNFNLEREEEKELETEEMSYRNALEKRNNA